MVKYVEVSHLPKKELDQLAFNGLLYDSSATERSRGEGPFLLRTDTPDRVSKRCAPNNFKYYLCLED